MTDKLKRFYMIAIYYPLNTGNYMLEGVIFYLGAMRFDFSLLHQGHTREIKCQNIPNGQYLHETFERHIKKQACKLKIREKTLKFISFQRLSCL